MNVLHLNHFKTVSSLCLMIYYKCLTMFIVEKSLSQFTLEMGTVRAMAASLLIKGYSCAHLLFWDDSFPIAVTLSIS